MVLLIALLLLQSPDDRAQALLSRTAFPPAEEVKTWADKGPEYKNVLEVVLKRDSWKSSAKFVEEKLGPFGDDWTIQVTLAEWDGDHPSEADRKAKQAVVRFNMRRLSAYEKKMIDFRRQEAELKKQRKRFAWKVPPLKYDRLIVHELVHVLQGPYSSPPWFHEGLASWAGADPNYVMGFLYAHDEVKDVESPLDGDNLYGRGQLFMMWLEKKSGAEIFKKLMKATAVDGADSKAALEKLLGTTWDKISAEELAWTTQYAKKNRPKKD